jgi:hypothetical protein
MTTRGTAGNDMTNPCACVSTLVEHRIMSRVDRPTVTLSRNLSAKPRVTESKYTSFARRHSARPLVFMTSLANNVHPHATHNSCDCHEQQVVLLENAILEFAVEQPSRRVRVLGMHDIGLERSCGLRFCVMEEKRWAK